MGGKTGEDQRWEEEWVVYKPLFGKDVKKRAKILEEGVEILKALWNKNTKYPFKYEGRHYRFELQAPIEPLPYQNPPPVWITANPMPGFHAAPEDHSKVVERALRRIAKIGDGWMNTLASPDEFGQRVRDLDKYVKDYGRSPNDVKKCFFYQAAVASTQADYNALYNETVDYLRRYGYRTDKEFLDIWVVVGGVDKQIEYLDRVVKAGAEHVIIRFTPRDQYNQLTKFTEEVMPSFQ